MSQYRIGTATFTSGSQVVVGQGTRWLTDGVLPGQDITVAGSQVWYVIGQVVSDTELRLSSAYVGDTVTASNYAVHRSYTPFYNFPYPAYGDIDTASLIQQALNEVERAILAADANLTIVESRAVKTPPAVPEEGRNYLVPADATGSWAGKGNKIAFWDSSSQSWLFRSPAEGMPVRVRDESYAEYIWDSFDGAWEPGEFGTAVRAVQEAAARVEVAAQEAEATLTDFEIVASEIDADLARILAARDATLAAADEAETSATNAAGSALVAASSATTSSNAAAQALARANDALNSKNAASASAASAAADAVTAGIKADAAATSATAAATSASTAGTRASEASTSAQNAANSAATATTRAGEAATSASQAAGSANQAATSANQAAASADLANTRASAAATSATAAATSASAAATSRADAQTAAVTATNKATEATTAAATATSAAASATADAATAGTRATQAASSATTAQAWAIKTDGPVSGSDWSAKRYASDASGSAVSAAGSAAAAATSANQASTSATTAGTHAQTATAAADRANTAANTAEARASAATTAANNANTAANTATAASSEANTARTAAQTASAAAQTSAGNAQTSATTATAAAADALAAKVDSEAARNLTITYRDATLAARIEAQAWASNPEGVTLPQAPGYYSAFHWAKKAEGYAVEARNIVGGNNFGIIGDGNAQHIVSQSPSEMLNFVQGPGIQITFNQLTRSIGFSSTVKPISVNSVSGIAVTVEPTSTYLALTDTGVVAGTVGSSTQIPVLTIDAKGRVTSYSTVSAVTSFAQLTGKPTTLTGYGVTDTLTTSGGIQGGGVLGSGLTLSLTDTGVTAGTYGSATLIPVLTLDAKGRVTGVSTASAVTSFAQLTGKPTTLSGYGISDAVNVSALGANNGVATLDGTGKVPTAQLPTLSYLPLAGGTLSGNLTVTGNLTINGGTTTVNSTTVTTRDNLIVINDGEVGAGVTAGVAGVQVNRGSLAAYQFLFDEADDSFKIGAVGDLQPVATRENTPLANGFARWNASAKRFDAVTLTSTDITTALTFTPANRAGDTFTGTVRVASSAPTYVFDETDQTGATGLWRWIANGGGLFLNRNTAAARDFSTVATPLSVDATDAVTFGSTVQATRIISTVAPGTAPFTVASPTAVTNLNADLLDGLHADSGAVASTVAARDASGTLRASGFSSQGTAPRDWMVETDGATDAKYWDTLVDGGVLYYRVLNDALATAANWMTVNRSGAAPTLVTMGARTHVNTLAGRQISAGGGINGWVDVSSNGGGVGVIANNLYTDQTSNDYRTANTHGSMGYAAIRMQFGNVEIATATGATTGGAVVTPTWNRVWHAGNDGAGSGLDADLLDGLNSSQFLRSDQSATLNGGTLTLTVPSGNSALFIDSINGQSGSIRFRTNTTMRWFAGTDQVSETGSNTGKNFVIQNYDDTGTIIGTPFSLSRATGVLSLTATPLVNSNVVWHAGNDGAGTGLDADLLDGFQASQFMRNDATVDWNGSASGIFRIQQAAAQGTAASNVNTLQILAPNGNDAFMTFHVASDYAVHFGLDGLTNDLFVGGYSMGPVKNKVWHAGNDGSGSGLDADTLDGQHATAFASAVHGHAIADVAGLQTTLNGLQAAVDGKANSAHTHTLNDLPSQAQNVILARTAAGTGPVSGISAPMLSLILAANPAAARAILGTNSGLTARSMFLTAWGA